MKFHYKSGTPAWQSWRGMIGRCRYEKHSSYRNYGGRGIKVCERWQRFENFLADMGERPEGMELDRINNDGDYEPGNCRWATRLENSRNRSNNLRLTHNGETLLAVDWARRLGLGLPALWARLFHYGWSVDRALTEPPKPDRRRAMR